MTELLTMFASPLWAYLALFAFLAVDALIPVVPTQAIMITSGALTVYGDLDLAVVIAVGAAGMFTGDGIAFVLGRSTGARLSALRTRFAPRHEENDSRTRRAAARFTRGLRRPGPLVMLLCRFVPGGRMASGYHAGRTGYPIRSFIGYDGAAALGWATYGGLVGHLGGTAVTQSAWRLFAVAATAAVVFGTAGWMLALFGGGDEPDPAGAHEPGSGGTHRPDSGDDDDGNGDDDPEATGSRAASVDAPPQRSSRRARGRS
jgi:membrane-associated protein